MRTRQLVLGVMALAATNASSSSAQEPPELTDAQIAHVAVTANAIDVEIARLAPARSDNPQVLEFARTMVTDHSSVNERAATLAGRLGVVPSENAVSASLRSAADPVRHTLSEMTGAAFDRAYIEREVAYHQAVLAALDGVLIPQARNAQLRALLEQVRPVIAAHLEHARRLERATNRSR